MGATGVAGAARRSDRCVLLSPVALVTMHHAWGAGFIAGVIAGSRQRKAAKTGDLS
jgi:hypothetical protein